MLKYINTKFEPNILCSTRVMSIFTERARPAKMMLCEASSFFAYQWLGNIRIHTYSKFEPIIPRESRIMSILLTDHKFIIDAKQSLVHQKMLLCMPVVRQC